MHVNICACPAAAACSGGVGLVFCLKCSYTMRSPSESPILQIAMIAQISSGRVLVLNEAYCVAAGFNLTVDGYTNNLT